MRENPAKPLEILIAAKGWHKLPRLKGRLQKVAAATLAALPEAFQFPCCATLLLSGNGAIKKLNRDFRGIDRPTNVLSFPHYAPGDLKRAAKGARPVELGDIMIAYQYTVAEAKAEHKILADHVSHLLIHGILHLFGYDHLTLAQAGKMEKLERQIMRDLGRPDPYADALAPVARSVKKKS